jgi:hypothetical protein
MARLIVEAEGTGGTGASSGVAKPGDQSPLYLIVSVTRTSGTAVTGLTGADFQVDPVVVAPGGAAVTIHRVGEPHPGLYFVEVVPIPAGTWKLGRYIFWIAVRTGTSRGQTVCAVFVD